MAKKKLYKSQSPTFLNINLFGPVGGLNHCPSTDPSEGEGLALLDTSVSVATSESELFAELIPSFRNLISLNHFFFPLHQIFFDVEVHLARLPLHAGRLSKRSHQRR